MKLRNIFIFSILLVGGGCVTSNGMPQPEMTFQHLQPLPVNVARIETDVRSGTEVSDFAVSPVTASERYLSSRFNAVGGNGTLRAVMEEVTVRHVYSPSKGNVTKYLNVGGHDVYDVKLVLRLEHISDSGTVLYGNTIKAQRTMNITEHASVAEREKHEMEGMEKLFTDLDQQVVRIIMTEMRLGAQ